MDCNVLVTCDDCLDVPATSLDLNHGIAAEGSSRGGSKRAARLEVVLWLVSTAGVFCELRYDELAYDMLVRTCLGPGRPKANPQLLQIEL